MHAAALPFGRENYQNNTYAFSVSNRYTGQQLDEDTGLYYYGARYYDPELARFIQADSTVPDPEFSQAYNRYAYVYNNPLKFTDPTGQEPFSIAILIATAVKASIVSAYVSMAVAAITGGDIGKAFLSGLIAGFCGGIGGIFGAIAGGALGALATGGDPLQGAISAGVAVGVQICLGFSPSPSGADFLSAEYLKELALSTASGALCGGVTAELMGGDFSEGAVSGAASAAAGYVSASAMQEHTESGMAGTGQESGGNNQPKKYYIQERRMSCAAATIRNMLLELGMEVPSEAKVRAMLEKAMEVEKWDWDQQAVPDYKPVVKVLNELGAQYRYVSNKGFTLKNLQTALKRGPLGIALTNGPRPRLKPALGHSVALIDMARTGSGRSATWYWTIADPVKGVQRYTTQEIRQSYTAHFGLATKKMIR